MWAACVSHCPGDGHPRQQARRGWRQREKGARPPTHSLRTSLRAPLWAPSCDLRVWPVGPSQAPARDSAQIIVCVSPASRHSSCLSVMNVCMAPGPLAAAAAACPGAGVLLRRRSPSGSNLGAGPCLPVTLFPRRPGACWAGLRLSLPQLSPPDFVPTPGQGGGGGGAVSRLLSPCGFGCFSCCVLDSN